MAHIGLLRVLATVAFLCMVLTNALANILPINGLNTGQVSDLYPTLFTPAGITFSIWSVIYFLLVGFLVLMWTRRNDRLIHVVLPWFVLSCFFNMAWIIFWHYLFPGISVLVMLLLLSTLAILFRKLQGSKNSTQKNLDLASRIWLMLPFTLYLAWICVATIANVAALLVSVNWNGGLLTAHTWAVIMMGMATIVAIKVTLDFRAPFFALVVIWALLGIYIRWRESNYVSIIYGAIAFIVTLLLVIIYSMRKQTTR